MKIKKLEFCNINSLAGGWTIDFESPDFAQKGMFCISGPTGSGKTSILDAVCLGLYGRTPRIKRITKSANEVMTYGAPICFSKVTFECGGITYLAHWQQERTPRSNKFEFKTYAWKLLNLSENIVLSSVSTQNEIETTISGIIGLDFEQFTKSIMLAQGEFKKFLDCSENERAQILEKLTGDSFYRDIAVAVHKLYQDAAEAVSNVESQMGGVSLLTAEELAALNSQIENAEGQKKKLSAEAERFNQICAWYKTSQDIERLLQGAEEALARANVQKAQFQPRREMLELALKAQEAEKEYSEFNAARTFSAEQQKKLEENNAKLPAAEDKLNVASEEATARQAALNKCRADYKASAALWNEILALDGEIKHNSDQLKATQNLAAEAGQEAEGLRALITQTKSAITENQRRLQDAENYLAGQAQDGAIESTLALLKAQINSWQEEQKAATEYRENLKAAQNKRAEFITAEVECNSELNSLLGYLEEHRADGDLPNILPEIKSQVSTLESRHAQLEKLKQDSAAEQNKLNNLAAEISKAGQELSALQEQKEAIIQEDIPVVVAELRRRLQAGAACPVCGSLAHPACGGAEHIAAGAERLSDFADKLRAVNEALENTRWRLDNLRAEEKRAREVLSEKTQKISAETKEVEKALKLLGQKLAPWKEALAPAALPSTLAELTALNAAYREKKQQTELLRQRAGEAEIKLARLEADLKSANDTLEKSNLKIEKLSREIATALTTWFTSIGPADFAARLGELEARQKRWKAEKENQITLEKRLEADSAALKQLEENLSQAEARQKKAASSLGELQNTLALLREKRRAKFGEKVVTEEQEKAHLACSMAEDRLKIAQEREALLHEEVIKINSSIADLISALSNAAADLAQKKAAFMAVLKEQNLPDEEAFLKAVLPKEERRLLLAEQEKVDGALKSANVSLENFNSQLAAQWEKRDFTESALEAEEKRAKAQEELAAYNRQLGTWQEQRATDEKSRQKYRALQEELDKLKARCADWEAMQHWFNGKNNSTGNGDKFVKFIQTITLKNLLKTANKFLADMFPRYEMVAAPDSLDIQLIDHENSDALRPISNISGGEGFLVSLALALGISTLASRNVRIDSMFLDEGFGTLDSRMLQDTVVVLQKMQLERGKLLGVITHLEQVKEEIGTRIEVIPGGGRSVLSGAGVSASRPEEPNRRKKSSNRSLTTSS